MDAVRTAPASRSPAVDQPPDVIFAALDEPVDAPSVASPGTGSEAPRWFQRRAEARRSAPPPLPASAPTAGGGPAKRKLRLETAEADEEPLPWRERVKRWIMGSGGFSYGISLLFHAALLILLALIVYHSLPDDERGTLMVDTREGEEVSLAEVDTRIDMPLAKEDLAPPQLQAMPIPDADTDLQLQASVEDLLPAVGAVGKGEGGGEGLVLPRGVNAVTRGSFTAWTIPEDPEPVKAYEIVIEIKVPDRLKSYRLVDLSGIVIGTDLYTQQIPYDPRNPSSTKAVRDGKPFTLRDNRASVPIVDGRIQLIIEVPGAARLVKDTIKVRSKLLKEEQELEIVF